MTEAPLTSDTGRGVVTVPGAVALYIGSVLGGGILVLPGLTAQIAGTGAIIAWVLVSALSLPLALLFGRLSALHPDGGGVSTFVRRAFGRSAGDITGWLYFWILPVGQPAVMLSGMTYVGYALGLSRGPVFILSALVLALAGVINAFGRTLSNRAQLGVAGAIVLILVATIAASIPSVHGNHFGDPAPHGIAAIGSAAALIMWAYIGWENVSFIARDFRNPRRDFPLSVVISVVVVGVLYTGSTLAVLGVLPSDKLGARAPLAQVIEQTIGVSAATAASIVASLIVTASAMAFVWGGSNLAASLAAHGSFPRSLSRLSDKGRIPVRAIVMLELSYLVGLTLIYVAHVSLATCGRIVGAAVILTYMASAAAYVRLTPSRGPRRFLSPALIIVLSLVLVPFFGLTLVYPAIVVAAYGGFRLLSRSAANDLMPVPQRALRHVSLNSTLEGKDLRER